MSSRDRKLETGDMDVRTARTKQIHLRHGSGVSGPHCLGGQEVSRPARVPEVQRSILKVTEKHSAGKNATKKNNNNKTPKQSKTKWKM